MARHDKLDAIFVSAPFFPAYGPSYAIEYLAALCGINDLSVECAHLHHDFGVDLLSRELLELYDGLKSIRYLGDFLVLARWSPSEAGAILQEMKTTVPQAPALTLEHLHQFFAAWNTCMDAFVADILRKRPRVVAFSATHYQLVASLWLAERIKTEAPDIKIVLGGYLGSLETCQDLLDRHASLDTIVFGEGDEVISQIIQSYKADDPVDRIIRGGRTKVLKARPDYSAYLQATAVTETDKSLTSVSYELSRGCYWDKCDFCNFNVAYGRFRRFESQDVLTQMEEISDQYGIKRFHLLDTSLPPAFAKQCNGRGDADWDIFVEIMADWSANMLSALRSFGVRRAQVGIESFSDDQLASMNKGMTVADNVAALTACQQADVSPVYGLLIGRPGDTAAHYEENLKFAEGNAHLPPPRYISECDIRPGSPLFRDRERLGISISFQGSAFERVLPKADHNCELRPSKVTVQSLQTPEIKKQRRLLEIAVNDWRDQHMRMAAE
ncbi:radical SAM protein [Sulfitobacter sp. HNIBRBA2951]|uniref:B12-binding domain-containing radical SAM protein n=1 Tax=Sulfitobacter aquimarinus TaxID=3158557 RepID=UPI0032E04946